MYTRAYSTWGKPKGQGMGAASRAAEGSEAGFGRWRKQAEVGGPARGLWAAEGLDVVRAAANLEAEVRATPPEQG